MNNYNYKDLYIGFNQMFEVKLTEEMLNTFVKLTGDVNPMHVNEEYAKSKKKIGRIIHGMLTSSFYSTLVGVYLPGERCFLQSIDVSFKLPAYINDELLIYGEIVYMNNAYKVVEIKSYIKNKLGKTISTAKIIVGVIE